MKNTAWLLMYFVLLALNCTGNMIPFFWLQNVTKPLLMPVLAVYFLAEQKKYKVAYLKKLVLPALFFSWGGDVLLIFQEKASVFFLLGLSSFLLAHIFYILLFHRIRAVEKITGKPLLLVIVTLYYLALMSWLSPSLGDMKIPVLGYGLVICFMLMLALHMWYLANKAAGARMAVGALLFVLSDSVLAINKFFQSFAMAGAVVMALYGIAQAFIITGTLKYIRSADQQRNN